jgi:hypothetical protein
LLWSLSSSLSLVLAFLLIYFMFYYSLFLCLCFALFMCRRLSLLPCWPQICNFIISFTAACDYIFMHLDFARGITDKSEPNISYFPWAVLCKKMSVICGTTRQTFSLVANLAFAYLTVLN